MIPLPAASFADLLFNKKVKEVFSFTERWNQWFQWPCTCKLYVRLFNMKLNLFNQLAQLITNAGGVGAVVDYIKESKGNVRLPGIMMLGYVAAHSETLAMSVIVSKVWITVHLYRCFIGRKSFWSLLFLFSISLEKCTIFPKLWINATVLKVMNWTSDIANSQL